MKNHIAARKATETFPERYNERYDVYAQNRMPMALAARSFSPGRPSITTFENGGLMKSWSNLWIIGLGLSGDFPGGLRVPAWVS